MGGARDGTANLHIGNARVTRTTNARVAGVTFLFYIAVGITSLVLFGRATTGVGIAAKLASIAQHATEVRLVVLLNLLASLSALVLGVTLYAITRDEDRDLAMLALLCRVAEGLSSFAGISTMLGVLWLATAIGPNAPGIEATQALGAFFLRGSGGVGAIFFALGSTLFAGLLLRGRMIPAALAWLGFLASALLVVILPLQLAGLFGGTVGWFNLVTWLVWLPMLLFEVAFALWLIVKGVATPIGRQLA